MRLFMATYKRYRKEDTVSYALGITLTFELLKFRTEQVNRIFIHTEMRQGETYDKLTALCQNAGIEMTIGNKIFNVLSGKENCYVIGEFQKYSSELQKDRSHIVLVSPSNAGNVGTIMRTALGFDLAQIAIIRPAVDAFDPKVIRASMGAVFSTDFVYFDTYQEYQEQFGERELYPFMLDAKTHIQQLHPRGIFSLIFGNEASGLPPEFAEVGTSVLIPHSDRIDSLNLPVAAGIAMYESTRNR